MIATPSDQNDSNVDQMVNVLVWRMSKADVVIDAKRTNMIDKEGASIVQTVTT